MIFIRMIHETSLIGHNQGQFTIESQIHLYERPETLNKMPDRL